MCLADNRKCHFVLVNYKILPKTFDFSFLDRQLAQIALFLDVIGLLWKFFASKTRKPYSIILIIRHTYSTHQK